VCGSTDPCLRHKRAPMAGVATRRRRRECSPRATCGGQRAQGITKVLGRTITIDVVVTALEPGASVRIPAGQ
jgi:hypothetical protein